MDEDRIGSPLSDVGRADRNSLESGGGHAVIKPICRRQRSESCSSDLLSTRPFICSERETESSGLPNIYPMLSLLDVGALRSQATQTILQKDRQTV